MDKQQDYDRETYYHHTIFEFFRGKPIPDFPRSKFKIQKNISAA